jgi:hypothetical protein
MPVRYFQTALTHDKLSASPRPLKTRHGENGVSALKCNSENECGHELGINNSQISQTALKSTNNPQQCNETKTAMLSSVRRVFLRALRTYHIWPHCQTFSIWECRNVSMLQWIISGRKVWILRLENSSWQATWGQAVLQFLARKATARSRPTIYGSNRRFSFPQDSERRNVWC